MNRPTYSSRLFEEIVLKSWWVILFFLLCLFIYDRGMQKKNLEERRLYDKLVKLQNETGKSLDKQEDLKLEIASQDDPAWIELVLMRRLGLVPEDETKILFLDTP